jgi:hypothetical protein
MKHRSCHSVALSIALQIQPVIIGGLGTDAFRGLQNAGTGYPGGLKIEMQVAIPADQRRGQWKGNQGANRKNEVQILREETRRCIWTTLAVVVP